LDHEAVAAACVLSDARRFEEVCMSSRKPTIDGLDDVDDEDGAVEEENAEDSDLTLKVESADEAILGRSGQDEEET
jgi:hypothetical protein